MTIIWLANLAITKLIDVKSRHSVKNVNDQNKTQNTQEQSNEEHCRLFVRIQGERRCATEAEYKQWKWVENVATIISIGIIALIAYCSWRLFHLLLNKVMDYIDSADHLVTDLQGWLEWVAMDEKHQYNFPVLVATLINHLPDCHHFDNLRDYHKSNIGKTVKCSEIRKKVMLAFHSDKGQNLEEQEKVDCDEISRILIERYNTLEKGATWKVRPVRLIQKKGKIIPNL